jgi:hypothetical protein
MRLDEIEQDYLDPEILKAQLLKPGTVPITNASYSRGTYSLGDLQRIGAGKIARKRAKYGGTSYGFDYFDRIGDELIMANILVGRHLIEPGGSFQDHR